MIYPDDFINKIIHGDCLEVMQEIPDESINLIITDPPYNVSKKKSNVSRGALFGQGGPINLDFGDWDYDSVKWTDFIYDFVRLLDKNGCLVLFYDKLYLGIIGLFLQKKGFQVRHIGSYMKTNPAPQARKVKWRNGVENFLVATKNKGAGHHFNYKLGQSSDYFMRSVNYKRFHPTQKPLDLIEWIINYWSFEEDLILDPFLGAGTTALACKNTNRRFIGIEKEEKYCEIARERLNAKS